MPKTESPVQSPHVTVFTDGACSGNPGPGGWGAILISGPHRKELSGGEAMTTNNRMELLAAISALEALKQASTVVLTTDSNYVKDGIGKWIHGWKRNGWLTADKKPVKNAELWQRLFNALEVGQDDDVWARWLEQEFGHWRPKEAEASRRPPRSVPARSAACRRAS